MMGYRDGSILVGKTLTGLKIAADRQALLFQTTEGDIKVSVDADCCSYTWVEHIELPALGFPAIVTAVAELDLPEPEDKTSTFHNEYVDVLAFYGCKITTDRGEIVIDYRNDSNGYYGGSLSWPDDHFYGGVYGQNVSKEEWQDAVSL
jgi:hypothetical protein